jgi:phosphatidylinositol glycan class B
MKRWFSLDTLFLGILILLGLLLRVSLALYFPNMFWPDEIFQTLEPAHRLAFGNGVVTWEFRDGIRSWVLPGVLAAIMHLTAWMGDGSIGYLTGVTIFLSLLSLSNILVGFYWGHQIGGLVTAIICAGISATWFELIFFAPKAFTEVIAAHFLLPGVYLGVQEKFFQPRTRLFLAGCCLGISLALRIHFIPAIVFAVVYICRRDWQQKWLPMMLGIMAPILLFGTVDAFTWSYPFQSFWLNIWVNLVEGKSKYYGISPWYQYIIWLFRSWYWLSIPIFILALIGFRRLPILGWLVLIIILSHSLLAHKEYRFIYPALPMVMILVGLGTAELILRLPRWLSPKRAAPIAILVVCLSLWASSSVVLASRFNIKSMNYFIINTNLQGTHWYAGSGPLIASRNLSTEDTICGLGLWGVRWSSSGGYTYLHRNIPIFPVEKVEDFDKLEAGFNYIVTNKPVPSPYQNYVLQNCERGTCIYKRPGNCSQIVDGDINHFLEQKGK